MAKSDLIASMDDPEDYEALWKSVLRTPHMMIWFANPQFQFVNSSQAGLDYYGMTMEELRAARWQEKVHPDDIASIEKNVILASREHPVIRQEYRARKRDGEYAWLLDISAPRYSADGTYLGYVGSIVDITEKKSQEERLKREIAKVSEWEQNRIGGDLHDGLAQAALGVSLKALALEHKLKKRDLPEFLVARKIAEESSRVLSGIRKLSEALFPPKLSRLDFRGALRNLAERYFQEDGVAVVLKVDPEAIPPDPDRALLLFRIAQEGLANAVRHSGAKRIEVSLWVERDGGCVLEVQDDGVGISGDPRANGGLGFRLVDYRVGLLGARIEIGGHRKGGTVLRCHYRA